MKKGSITVSVTGLAGEFLSFMEKVISAGKAAGDTQRLYRLTDYQGLPFHCPQAPRHQEGIVQITQIMVYRASSGKTAGQMNLVAIQILQTAFPIRILVSSDDHSPFILPQIEDHISLDLTQKLFFQGQIIPGLCLAGDH